MTVYCCWWIFEMKMAGEGSTEESFWEVKICVWDGRVSTNVLRPSERWVDCFGSRWVGKIKHCYWQAYKHRIGGMAPLFLGKKHYSPNLSLPSTSAQLSPNKIVINNNKAVFASFWYFFPSNSYNMSYHLAFGSASPSSSS